MKTTIESEAVSQPYQMEVREHAALARAFAVIARRAEKAMAGPDGDKIRRKFEAIGAE